MLRDRGIFSLSLPFISSSMYPPPSLCNNNKTQLRDQSNRVIENAAMLLEEIAKQKMELCHLILNADGVAALIDYLGNTRGYVRLPGIMALGYIASHSEALAMAVIVKWVCSKLLMHPSNQKNYQIIMIK